jgi:hypothetical protein
MESFYLHRLPNDYGMLMYGDYGTVYIEPSSKSFNIIYWLAGCRSLDYFAEKVQIANDCNTKIKDFYNEKFIEDLKEYLKDYDDLSTSDAELMLELALNIDSQHEAIEFLQENEIYDEYDLGMDYTYQFKNQHRCMIYGAARVIEEIIEGKKHE